MAATKAMNIAKHSCFQSDSKLLCDKVLALSHSVLSIRNFLTVEQDCSLGTNLKEPKQNGVGV